MRFKTKLSIIILVSFNLLSLLSKAQKVQFEVTNNDVESFTNLQIRPQIEFFIPAGVSSSNLPTNLFVDAQYWAGTKLDLRGGFKIGSQTGVTLGGTLHLKDNIVDKRHRFILGREKINNGKAELVTSTKIPLKARVISGPCVDVFLGTLKGAGFTPNFAFGWDFQTMKRGAIKPKGYQNSIQSSGNGWVSLKIQAVVTNILTEDEYQNFVLVKGERTMAFGGQVDLNAAARPWKGGTFYGGLTMGALNVSGPTGGISPIFSFRLGMAICKKK